MRKKSFKLLLVFTVIACLSLSQVAFAAGTAGDKDINYLKSVMDMIKQKYNGEVTDNQLIEGALKGMFSTMDPYTVFYNTDEAGNFIADVDGKYSGIGVMISKADKYIIVTKVFPASPAEKAGITPGTKIVTVDGKSVVGASIDEVSQLVRGEDGSKVSLGIIKSGEEKASIIDLVRAEVRVNPISYVIKGDIGYLKIDSFNANTSEYLVKALYEFDRNNIKKVILDLRDNPGGQLKQVVEVAQYFVPSGPVLKVDYKAEDRQDTVYPSFLQSTKYKMVVLVNGMSASASEVLAGALQDTKAATLVGTKTFGKAKVQELIPILTPEAFASYKAQYGSNLVDAYDLISKYKVKVKKSEVMGWTKITTAHYTTPNGRMIDGVGLTPDFVVEDPAEVNGVRLGNILKLTETVKPELGSDGPEVYNAEKILKVLGYDIGAPDMVYDQKTFDAVLKFQEDSGFFPYGVMDFEAQRALNEKLEQLVIENDKQYSKALELLK